MKFLVGFPAGGAQDIVGRIIADRLGALWKATTVVETFQVPAAISLWTASPRARRTARRSASSPRASPPTSSCIPVAFDPEKDIVALGLVANVPNLLCVRKDLPVNSVAELIAYAKANPGKLNFASSGIGTTIHLSAELFKRMAGVDMAHVAYRGSAPALNDLVGQSVDLMFDNITSIIGQARAGTVKPLGITLPSGRALRRSMCRLPLRCRAMRRRHGPLWVRAGTPKEICDKIEADTRSSARTRCCGNGWQTGGRDVIRGRNDGLHRVRAREVGQADHGPEGSRGIAPRAAIFRGLVSLWLVNIRSGSTTSGVFASVGPTMGRPMSRSSTITEERRR